MSTEQKLLVDIYRTKKKEGMYLYVKKGEDLEQLPEALMKQFGRAELAMSIVLHPQRRLANADVNKVLANIAEQQYYLQMPPLPEALQAIPNDKLPLHTLNGN